MVEKKNIDADTRRKNMSFLQLIFPVFLLLLIPSSINGSTLYPLVLKILIFGYQYFITQHFVNSLYN
jgi:hypothetical protein